MEVPTMQFDILASLLFPKALCIACAEPRRLNTGAQLCDACKQSLQQEKLIANVCPQCLSPKSSNTPRTYCLQGGMQGFAAAYSPYHYHGVVQRLIVKLKFSSVDDAALPLVEAMLLCVHNLSFDAMVPIPLSRKRLLERGFNQAEWMCQLMARSNGLPILNAMTKTKETRRQSSLQSEEERKQNVVDAFSVIAIVEGMHLLLVDDVRTSGATARACAKVLLLAGASSVSLLTAAVAPHKLNMK